MREELGCYRKKVMLQEEGHKITKIKLFCSKIKVVKLREKVVMF